MFFIIATNSYNPYNRNSTMSFFMKKIMVVCLGIMIAFPLALSAQFENFDVYSADDIFVETTPNVPGPNQEVKLRLNSYSFNLNNYYIAWFENGVQKIIGFGERDYTFRTGAPGVITNITAVIEFEGRVFRKELRFAPSQVDMLWQAIDAYTPPFYKGKALPLKQSRIRVTGVPETIVIEPTDAPNLVYYWDRNYQRNVNASGFGKQSYEFTADPLNIDERITLTTNDRRENSTATNTVIIPVSQTIPKVLFYEIGDRGRLLTQRALNNNPIINSDTIRMSFHPLHMSSTEPNFVDMFVDWRINNTMRPPQDFAKQNELYITTGGESGAVSVYVGLEGIQKLMQKVNASLELVFNG